jgi:hypothetical protein
MKFRILEDTTKPEGIKYIVQKKVLFFWHNLDGLRYINIDLANKAIANYIKHKKTNCIKVIETSEPVITISPRVQ